MYNNTQSVTEHYSLQELQQTPLGETNMGLVPIHRACPGVRCERD